MIWKIFAFTGFTEVTRAILANNFFLYEKWIDKNNSLCQCNDFISSYHTLNSYLDDPLAEWIIWIIVHWKNETIRFYCFSSLTLHVTSFCIVHKRLTSIHRVALFFLQSTPESITIVSPIQWKDEKFRRCHLILISFMELRRLGRESLFTGGRHYLLVKGNSPESLFTGK